ncbi:uncharacterized protein [Panulirus ornatus]|uniref:uncharacterized protein n=1 Tax=Panulirus ornatus TaxID=150431 RepID=UPI003A8BB1A4
MMASSAVYPTPSVGCAASWCWLPKSHVQEERYFKQLYQPKPSRDLGVQRDFGLQGKNCHFEFDDQLKRKYSHSLVSAPHKKPTLKSGLSSTRNVNEGAEHNNEVFKKNNNLLLKSSARKETQESTVKTCRTSTFSPTQHTSREGPEGLIRLQPQLTTKREAISQQANESRQNSLGSGVPKGSKKSKSKCPSVISTLTCFLCQKRVKEVHFQEHLFFGPIRCHLCNQVFLDCRSFQALTVDTLMKKHSCDHELKYVNDPFTFVGALMCQGTHIPGSLFPSKVLVKLSLYIGKMRSLENKDPWKAAIAKCKKYLPSILVNRIENTGTTTSDLDYIHKRMKASTPSETNDNNTNTPSTEDHPRLIKDARWTAAHILENNRAHSSKNHHRTGEKILREMDNSDRLEASILPLQPPSASSSSHPPAEEDIGDLLLPQNYSLEHLEKAIEYVEVAGDSRTEDLLTQRRDSTSKTWTTTKTKTKKKKRLDKKQKLPKASSNPPVEVPEEEKVEEEEEEEEIMSTEFVETPANGYYYVVKHAIEECPMCYTLLCPSRFTVNVVTFLITAVCTGCDLTIYIVPELPDGTTPGVSIVTENPPSSTGGGDSLKPPEKEKKKRRRRPTTSSLLKPKKTTTQQKTSKPQDFFCK